MKASAERDVRKTAPIINVTPLIDVLLVLLIIFMVITPLEPSRFKAHIPQPPPPDEYPPPLPDISTLVVTIDKDLNLRLNKMDEIMGSVDDTTKLSAALARVIQERREKHAYRYEMRDRIDLPDEMRIQKTVYIKAPRGLGYGQVAKVIDGVKGAGADPIGLQVDGLD